MNKTSLHKLLLPLLGMVIAASTVSAREVSLYAGGSISSANITVYQWGSGTIKEDATTGFQTTKSILVTSPGSFAGGFIRFAQATSLGDPSSVTQYDYLEFEVKFKIVTPLGISPSGNAKPVNGEYLKLPLDIAGGNYDLEELPQVPKARTLKAVIYSDDGRVLEQEMPIVLKQTDEDGWFAVAFPLAGFGITSASPEFKVVRMALSSEYPDSFNVGQIRVITDDSPIFLDSLGADQSVAPTDVLVFQGIAEAGKTSLLYSWDFNETDGIQEDAQGILVKTTYKTAGTYVVTLTVKDPSGIKKPASTKVSIEVL